ncbi:MAG: IS1182 family transposase [Rhodospirillales bacterium]|jgi:transposase|nr:IS1182 family transposase [Rhodospirillales bacterium]|tara:strand:+ start:450 stop:1808 length:1359 start_codon:yes stop_codon:yes gene_type:complete
MMGQAVGQQDRLFYEFNLEDRVPANHLLRRIDAVLDLTWLRSELSPFYSHTGCPSIDPELMIRMLLVGYCHSIRSERRLCQEVELNLAYRWFCRLGLEDRVPNHSTFSVNRHGRFRDGDVFRLVFENVVRQCMEAGLVAGEGFAVDASVIEADASRFQRIEGAEVEWSEEQLARRSIKEYVDALESDNAPINPDRKPKAMSPTDPISAWTTRGRHKVMFGYSLNYLIDMENAIIVDVEATPTRITKEVDATETMIERTEDRFALKPRHIAGDVAYGTGEMLGWLVDRDIDPHVPVWDQSEVAADGKFVRADFTYEKDRDLYICPGGKELKTSGTVHDGTTIKYIAKRSDCAQCPLKPKCTTGRERRISRDVNQEARDYTRALMETDAYKHSRSQRKKIERLFGEAKHIHALVRLRLRGLSGAKDEFLLTATVQNLKRLAKHAIRPPPRPMFA